MCLPTPRPGPVLPTFFQAMQSPSNAFSLPWLLRCCSAHALQHGFAVQLSVTDVPRILWLLVGVGEFLKVRPTSSTVAAADRFLLCVYDLLEMCTEDPQPEPPLV